MSPFDLWLWTISIVVLAVVLTPFVKIFLACIRSMVKSMKKTSHTIRS